MENLSDSSTWPGWLREKGPRFLLFARTQTRCEADAPDVLQEALVEAWRRGDGLHPPDDALVFSTIRRRAIDLARRTDRRQRREETAWFEPETPGDFGPELAQAVQKLPDHLREVLTMKIWGEFTFRQIAETLGIPLNTAASRYRYALEHLRAAYKEVRS